MNDLRELKVLVVEDDLLIREMVAEHLRAFSWEVVEASTGEGAVEALQKRDSFDAVFTDIRLGGATTGWDVGEVSRLTHPDIPVVYTSGATLLPERPVAGSVFIPKPYEPRQVLAVIEKLRSSR